jgi:osmotically-inducible protein OsmY
MTLGYLNNLDVAVRNAVMKQLEWDPAVDASAIGVSATKGTITLTGAIDTYAGKLAAERAAKRVRGVRAVANDLDVRLISGRTDSDIASDVTKMLRLNQWIPEAVQATVKHAHVTLSGNVPWIYQKREAGKAVRHVRGVVDVRNLITIAPQAIDRDVRRHIAAALHRHVNVDASHITVGVDGGHVTLTGFVESWAQREAAEHAAADAPGVAAVHNRLIVEPLEPPFEGDVDDAC